MGYLSEEPQPQEPSLELFVECERWAMEELEHAFRTWLDGVRHRQERVHAGHLRQKAANKRGEDDRERVAAASGDVYKYRRMILLWSMTYRPARWLDVHGLRRPWSVPYI